MDDQLVEERIRRAFDVIADEIKDLQPRHQRGRWLVGAGGGVLAAAAICLGLALAFGPNGQTSELRPDAVAASRVLERLGLQTASEKRWIPKTLAEALPNQPLRMPDGSERPASEAVVSGRVIAADPGAGYVQPSEPDGASPMEVPFDSPAADFVVVRLTIEVDDAVDLDGDTIDVGVRFTGSPRLSAAETEEIVAGLRGLGDVLVVLSGQGGFSLDRDLYRISGETLLGLVGPDGQVTLPGHADQDSFLQGLTTVNDVMRQAQRPTRPAIPIF